MFETSSLIQLATLIVQTEFTIVWCLIILAIAVGDYLYLRHALSANVSRPLQSARQSIELNNGSQIDFCRHFDLGSIDIEEAHLGKAWQEFAVQLKHSNDYKFPSSDSQILISLNDPHEFFHPENLINGAINMSLFRALPGILTGFGILGTFVGLACGVYLASNGINFSEGIEIGIIITSMQGLLHGAGQAFWTSIAGLFTSICFLISIRRLEYKTSKEINDFADLLSNYVVVLTPELLSLHQYQQMGQQNQIIQEMYTQWKLDMQGMLDALFQRQINSHQNIVDGLEKVEKNINVMTTQQGQMVGQILNEGIQDFGKLMQTELSNMTASFDQSAAAISDTVEQLDSSMTKLESLIDQTSVSVKNNLENIAVTVTSIQDSFRQGQEDVQQLLTNAVDAGKSIRTDLQEGSNKLKTNLDSGSLALVEAMNDINDFYNHQQSIVKEFVDISKNVSLTADSVRTNIGELQAFTNNLSTWLSKLEEQQESFNTKIADSITRINDQLQDSLTQWLETYQTQQTKFNDELTETSTKVAEQINDSLSNWQEAFESQQEAFNQQITESSELISEQINDSLSQWSEDIKACQNEFNEQLMASATLVSEQIADSKNNNTEIKQSIDSYREQTSELLFENLTKLSEALNNLHNQMSRNLATADSDIAKALSTLSDTVDAWESSQKLVNKKLHDHVDTLNKSTELLSSSIGKLSQSHNQVFKN